MVIPKSGRENFVDDDDHVYQVGEQDIETGSQLHAQHSATGSSQLNIGSDTDICQSSIEMESDFDYLEDNDSQSSNSELDSNPPDDEFYYENSDEDINNH